MVVKEKHSLVNLKAIAIILECFPYWTTDFEIGWSMFADNGSNLLKFYALSNTGNLALPAISEVAWKKHVVWNVIFAHHTITQ